MDDQRDWRKKQRALVNALRDASVHRTELRAVGPDGEPLVTVVVDRIHHDERGTIDSLSLLGAPDDDWVTSLVVEDVDDECTIPLTRAAGDVWRVQLDGVTPASWRTRTRWAFARPFTTSATLVSGDTSQFATVHLLGLDNGLWRVDVEPAAEAHEGDRLVLHPTATADRTTEFEVVHARGRLVLASRRLAPVVPPAGSVVPHAPADFEFEIAELGLTAKVRSERYTADGFQGRLIGQPVPLPDGIGGMLRPVGAVCTVRPLDPEARAVDVSIIRSDRVRWYNWLTRHAFGHDTRLRPADARSVTRLMQESRNYTDAALRRRVGLGPSIAATYELDNELPSTRFRWMVRHSESDVVGHLMGIQASSRVWSAIDNVGSQSHPGRWNARVVAQWIRAFGELVRGLAGEPLIQWSFKPGAGVWSAFFDRVREHRELIHVSTEASTIMLWNLPEQGTTTPVASEETCLEGILDDVSRSSLSRDVALFLEPLCAQSDATTAFGAAFEREYRRPFRRWYRRLTDADGARHLLTFANHPTWPSLNQGHNATYLVPLDAAKPTMLVLDAIRRVMLACGCEPFRAVILGGNADLGVPWVDMLLRPGAMELAAQAAEAF